MDLLKHSVYFFREYKQIDWLIMPCIFVTLPHFMQSLAALGRQKWPTLKFELDRGFSIKENLTRIWTGLTDYVVQVLKFDWFKIIEAVPVLHFFKRLSNCMTLIKSPEKQKEIQAIMEEENLYCSIWHSGPQVILQLALIFQLNQINIIQVIGLAIHSWFIIQSSSSFYFSQRSQPQYQTKCAKERLLAILLIAPLHIVRLLSLAFLFSYAKTYVPVAFIVIFGIAMFALFYEIFIEEQSKMLQLMQLLLSIWNPIIPGFSKNFDLKTIASSFGLHLFCHFILMAHIGTQQYPTIKDLPQQFHCFPVPNHPMGTKYCPVLNRFDIQVDSCQSNPPQNVPYIRICEQDEYPFATYFMFEIGLIVLLFVSFGFNMLLWKISKKENESEEKI